MALWLLTAFLVASVGLISAGLSERLRTTESPITAPGAIPDEVGGS